MELSGSVTVEGIATLEKLLENAETFRKLGDYKKEEETLTHLTKDYPSDYRAWLRLGLSFLEVANIYSELPEYHTIKEDYNHDLHEMTRFFYSENVRIFYDKLCETLNLFKINF